MATAPQAEFEAAVRALRDRSAKKATSPWPLPENCSEARKVFADELGRLWVEHRDPETMQYHYTLIRM